MKLRISAILLFSFFTQVSFGQIRPYDKKVFRQNFEQGNLLILEQFYDTALKTFLILHEMDTANANVNYKVGFLYLQSSSLKNKALPYLKSASRNITRKYVEFEPSEKRAPEIALYYLAIALHLDYRFDEAIAAFEKYKTMVSAKNVDVMKDIVIRMDWCRNAKIFVETPIPYLITNLGDSVNSPYAEYSPVISADEEVLMFTSVRKGTGGEANQTPEGGYFEDIWVCYRKKDGTWTQAKSIGATINTFENEATIGLSADGQQLFIYKDDNGDGNIYMSELNGDVWGSPDKMGVGEGEVTDVNTTSWETHACVTADGNTLYFVSDRKGGLGGRDIYKCVKLPNGKWSKARNLGPSINTPYDEDAPFMHPDGVTMFFSSKGHNSMGGFDIFFSTRSDSGWTQPVNMGYPLNTTDDDVFYVLSTDGKRAYFSSFREDGKGEKDIYMVSSPKTLVEPVALMIYYLKNVNGDPLDPSTIVHLTSTETGQITDFIPNRTTGKLVMTQPPCKPYTLTVEVNGNVVYTDDKFKSDCTDFNETQKEGQARTIWLGGPPPTTMDDGTLMMISGVLNDKKSSLLADVNVKLTDSKGEVNETVKTDVNGEFKFSNLKNDRNYVIDIDAYDDELKPGTSLKIGLMKGGEIANTKVTNKPNKIKYLLNVSTNTITVNIPKRGEVVVKKDDPPVDNVKTKVEFINIEGTVMDLKLPSTPLSNVITVKLTDDKNTISMTTTTENGKFKFTHVPAGNNYLIMLDEYNTVAANLKTITITDEATGKELSSTRTTSTGDNKFKVSDTKKSITVRLKKKTKEDQPVPKDDFSKFEDKSLQFGDAAYQHNFTYARTSIDVNSDEFEKLIDAIIARYNSTGYCKVYINSSASKVPVNPNKFKNNGELAKARAAETSAKIISALKAKGFDPKKIVFTSNYNTKGPEYRNDFIENRAEYEKYQYVKVFLLDKK